MNQQQLSVEEMRRVWKRMDMVQQRRKAERRIEIITFLLACALIAAVAWAMSIGR